MRGKEHKTSTQMPVSRGAPSLPLLYMTRASVDRATADYVYCGTRGSICQEKLGPIWALESVLRRLPPLNGSQIFAAPWGWACAMHHASVVLRITAANPDARWCATCGPRDCCRCRDLPW